MTCMVMKMILDQDPSFFYFNWFDVCQIGLYKAELDDICLPLIKNSSEYLLAYHLITTWHKRLSDEFYLYGYLQAPNILASEMRTII